MAHHHKKKPCTEKTQSQHIDMILYELRDLRKEVSELKTFMNKSKGTVTVLVFLAGIVATIVGSFQYLFGK